jgi:hypothetical protein
MPSPREQKFRIFRLLLGSGGNRKILGERHGGSQALPVGQPLFNFLKFSAVSSAIETSPCISLSFFCFFLGFLKIRLVSCCHVDKSHATWTKQVDQVATVKNQLGPTFYRYFIAILSLFFRRFFRYFVAIFSLPKIFADFHRLSPIPVFGRVIIIIFDGFDQASSRSASSCCASSRCAAPTPMPPRGPSRSTFRRFRPLCDASLVVKPIISTFAAKIGWV